MRRVLYTATLSMVGVAGCSGIVETPDEGPGSTGVAICSSNTFWKEGDKGSPFMRPGGKCNGCHDADVTKKAPDYAIAGTVYPTAHEPDDCNSIIGVGDTGISDVAIVIIDSTGRALPDIPVNSAGNFFHAVPVPAPYKVRVRSKGKESRMEMSPPTGDCNSCHTQQGANNAPGRIVIP
jgi:hypothetical protein